MEGLAREAVTAAMKSTWRTVRRPPWMCRRPRWRPLSRAIGATPTSAAISFRFRAPSSGSSAMSVAARIGPTPRTLCSRSSRSRQRGLA